MLPPDLIALYHFHLSYNQQMGTAFLSLNFHFYWYVIRQVLRITLKSLIEEISLLNVNEIISKPEIKKTTITNFISIYTHGPLY